MLLWWARLSRPPGVLDTLGQCPPVALINSLIIMLSEYKDKIVKTFNNGSLGSGIDEERSEMR